MSKNYRAELTGVFGDPVDDNPTGVTMEAGYEKLGLNYRYITVKVQPEDLETAMAAVRAFGMKGINLTMPHKIKVIPYLDELTQAASIIGAVNTVVAKDGKLIGENTDGKGFSLSLLEAGVTLENKVITILGAGGAARAIAVELALAGAGKIYILNRTEKNGTELADLLNEKTGCLAEYRPLKEGTAIPGDTQILINATSIGLAPKGDERPPVDYSSVPSGIDVCDVVFCPADSLFLQAVRERGCVTHSGLGMLVRQAALNFTLWTGEEAPVDVMTEVLTREMG